MTMNRLKAAMMEKIGSPIHQRCCTNTVFAFYEDNDVDPEPCTLMTCSCGRVMEWDGEYWENVEGNYKQPTNV